MGLAMAADSRALRPAGNTPAVGGSRTRRHSVPRNDQARELHRAPRPSSRSVVAGAQHRRSALHSLAGASEAIYCSTTGAAAAITIMVGASNDVAAVR